MEFDPQSISGFWTVPAIAEPSANPVQVVVAVAVADESALGASDLTVTASSGGTTLAQLSAPDSSAPLAVTVLKGLTAQAFYTFDNPQGVAVDTVVVTIRGESATFTASGFPSA